MCYRYAGWALVALTLAAAGRVQNEPPTDRVEKQDQKATVTDRRLVHVTPGKVKGEPLLFAGDMLQLEPFTFPVVAEFVGASLKVTLAGDRALELVGQTAGRTQGEGKTSRSAFLLAREPGMVRITVTLITGNGKPAEDYEPVTYEVRVMEASEAAVAFRNDVLAELRKMGLAEERVQELIRIGDQPNKGGPLPLDFLVAVTKARVQEEETKKKKEEKKPKGKE